MNKTLSRIVLSSFVLCLVLTACASRDSLNDDIVDLQSPEPPPEDNGIGTSPSGPIMICEASPDGLSVQCEGAAAPSARAAHVLPCGLWWSPTSTALAVARHDAAPTDPDMAQLALPGGLSCSALLAAAPAVVASQGGAAAVYYVQAP